MNFIFKYLKEKIFNYYKIQSFKLFQKKQRNNYYYNYYEDWENTMEINESLNDFQLLFDELSKFTNKDCYFKRLPKQCRCCVFSYLDKKDKESFNYIPNQDRFCCFRYLDKKTIDKLFYVPEKDRFRCFKHLDNINLEALKKVPEEDQFRCSMFLYKKKE